MTYRYKTKTISLTKAHLVLGVKAAKKTTKAVEYCLEGLTFLPSKKPQLLAVQCLITRTSVTSRFLQNSKETLYLHFKSPGEMRNWQA